MKKIILILLLNLLFLIYLSQSIFSGEISFVLTGDILPGSNIEPERPFTSTDKYLPYTEIFYGVKNILRSGDITIGNLEGVMCDTIYQPAYKGENSYSFRIPPVSGKILKDSGFDVLNIANNHSLDCLREGLINMRYHLKKVGIYPCGFYKADNIEINLPEKIILKPVIIRKKELNIIILGFSTSRFFKSINNSIDYIPIIRIVSKKCNILVVTFHGGAEGDKSYRVLRKREFFHNEKRGDVYKFAHDAIDNGADIVFGHGPHQLRGIEVYKKKFIAYSLGDLCGNGLFKKIFKNRGRMGISAIIKIKVNSHGNFISGNIFPISIRKKGVPVIDSEKTGIKFIQELSRIDFPDSPLIIKNNGIIKIKE